MSQTTLRYDCVPSPFGELAILWSPVPEGAMVRQVLLPTQKGPAVARLLVKHPQARWGDHPDVRRLIGQFATFFSGQPVVFSLDLVALQQCTDFQRRVLLAEYGIPRGSVSTYGLLAWHVGAPGAARAAGSALANNPFPIIIPCHRAIRSNGELGGYQGGLAMKRALLEMEGVTVDLTGRVVAPRLHYSR